jgi:hypothetical protein
MTHRLGAQTERRDGAGLGRDLLGGGTSPAAFLEAIFRSEDSKKRPTSAEVLAKQPRPAH